MSNYLKLILILFFIFSATFCSQESTRKVSDDTDSENFDTSNWDGTNGPGGEDGSGGTSGGTGQRTRPTDSEDPNYYIDPGDPFRIPEEYGPPGPYAETLQKALHFYDINKSGIGITGGRIQWRGNSGVSDYSVPLFCNGQDPQHSNCVDMSEEYVRKYIHIFDPDGIGTINVGGGFHDCGDHVKFGLPQSYAASTLAWAMYEFPESFIKSGQSRHALSILRRFANYFMRSTFREIDGSVIAFAHQVGVGSVDHAFWGPPELQKSEDFPRPARFATLENPAADVTAGASAALALTYLVFKDSDLEYAKKALDTALALYEFAAENRGAADSGGFYPSEYEDDELSWAAIWLHIATGEDKYIDDIISVSGNRYTGYLGKIMSSTEDGWYNAWVHCWNTVWSGVFLKLAQITNDPKWLKINEDHVNLWAGLDGNRTVTAGGLSFLSHWGTLRYNAAAQMTALIWARHTGEMAYVDWADSQMRYFWGNNHYNKSYIVGFGDAWFTHIHNRAAHGSTKDNSLYVPPTPSHIAWGALLGGPTYSDGEGPLEERYFYLDDIWEYTHSESCIDYSSSLVGAIAGLYYFKAIDESGLGEGPIPDFPPLEPPQREYWVEGRAGQDDAQISEIKLMIHNESVHPPYLDPNLSIRYFFNISELKEWNQGIDDIYVTLTYDGRSVDNGMLNSGDGLPTIVLGPYPWKGSDEIYYYEFSFEGCKFYGSIPFEFQLVARGAHDHQPHQDSSNDYSRQGLIIGDEYVVTPYVPLYSEGVLIAGEEPQ